MVSTAVILYSSCKILNIFCAGNKDRLFQKALNIHAEMCKVLLPLAFQIILIVQKINWRSSVDLF